MTTQTEALSVEDTLKLALEALKQMKAQANFDCWNLDICDEAITATEKALAQPSGSVEQRSVNEHLEPVVIQYASKAERDLYEMEDEDDTTPPQPQNEVRGNLSRKPLTSNELNNLLDEVGCSPYSVARAIEAAHGIKE